MTGARETETSRVHFVPARLADGMPEVGAALRRLLDGSGLLAAVRPGARAVVKLHFGEGPRSGQAPPALVRVLVDALRARGATAVLADTNTLYKGPRLRSETHRALALRHGYGPEATGAEVVVPDETRPEERLEVEFGGRHVRSAKLLRLFCEADLLVGLAHVKGHLAAGMGGAVKNIGMGCASREGKMAQHAALAPVVDAEACTACGACVEACPAGAVSMTDEKARVDGALCVGCAACVAACEHEAMNVNWESGGGTVSFKIAEYAGAVLRGLRWRAVFVNYALRITKECDCFDVENPVVCPDVGLFASTDPVALDRACLDAVLAAAGRDVFREAHPRCDPAAHVAHAAAVGAGRLAYERIDLA